MSFCKVASYEFLNCACKKQKPCILLISPLGLFKTVCITPCKSQSTWRWWFASPIGSSPVCHALDSIIWLSFRGSYSLRCEQVHAGMSHSSFAPNVLTQRPQACSQPDAPSLAWSLRVIAAQNFYVFTPHKFEHCIEIAECPCKSSGAPDDAPLEVNLLRRCKQQPGCFYIHVRW